MSLLGSIGNVFKKAAKGIAGVIDNPLTRAVGQINPMIGAVTNVAGVVAGNQKLTSNVLGGYNMATGFAYDPRPTTTPGSWVDQVTPDILVRPTGAAGPKQLKNGRIRYPRYRADGSMYFPRRMNPLNPRAARRAIRRIKAVRRITRDIERSLPKQTTRRRAA